MATYSFQDVVVAIEGPGGAFIITGHAEEGITVEPAGDKNTMVIGAGGEAMHSLHADRSGHATLRLLKTSSFNRQLGLLYDFQTSSSSNHGQSTLTVRDKARGDVTSCRQTAFKKRPQNAYAKEANIIEWQFDVGIMDMLFGSGSPALTN